MLRRIIALRQRGATARNLLFHPARSPARGAGSEGGADAALFPRFTYTTHFALCILPSAFKRCSRRCRTRLRPSLALASGEIGIVSSVPSLSALLETSGRSLDSTLQEDLSSVLIAWLIQSKRVFGLFFGISATEN